MANVILKGITWGHSRGLVPLQAVSQRYSELNPGIRIEWTIRTLQEFADFPIEKLTSSYDLLVIDHPWVGRAASLVCVLPLDQYLPISYLKDQYTHSIGHSHESYYYNGHQWALAIDAATPVASFRKDLFEVSGRMIPSTWQDLLALADEGKVALPAIPIDLLMNFYGFCISCGETPFLQDQGVVSDAVGIEAMELMKALYSKMDPCMFEANPIRVAEMMTTTDNYWYCPFAYGYSNYSRQGYASHVLHYGDVISVHGEPLRTTLGGTGLSISAYSEHKDVAVDFAQYVGSSEIQRTMYAFNGGQPGHAGAWDDEMLNNYTQQYFRKTKPVLDRSYMRPRYNGYLHFQDHAGAAVQACMKGLVSPAEALKTMHILYHESLLIRDKK